VIVPGG